MPCRSYVYKLFIGALVMVSLIKLFWIAFEQFWNPPAVFWTAAYQKNMDTFVLNHSSTMHKISY